LSKTNYSIKGFLRRWTQCPRLFIATPVIKWKFKKTYKTNAAAKKKER
jgi:hypothetical protein